MSQEPRFPEPRMRDAFRRELRARLMAEAPAALAPRRENAWRFLRPAFAVGLAGVVLVGGAGTAAAGSLPGDPAFVLKRTFEDVQVNLTFDDVQRVQLLAQIADRRLQELQQIANKDDNDQGRKDDKAVAASEEFAQAVARFRSAVDAVQQAAPAEKSEKVQDLVEAARDKHAPVLDQVKQQIDNEKAHEAIERAKDEEEKDTKADKDKKDKDPKKTARPTPSRTASPSPRASASPRTTPRVETTRPSSATPHTSPRASAEGDKD